MPPSLRDTYPARAAHRAGERATLVVELEHDGGPVDATLTARLRDAATVVAEATARHRLEPGANELRIEVDVPSGSGRGYEALLELRAGDDRAHGATSLLAIDEWGQAPRYGFLSEFAPNEPGADRVRELAKFHVTVVQFYDWMYRHYAFLPPEDEFVDAMERRLSLQTVRERVEACHRAGMAALAYGAVYGPEPEFVREHPDWVLRDGRGREHSLIDRFFITDLREGAPWREHILREFEVAVGEVGFDGIHMDQYGFPKWAYDADGEAVDLARAFPGLIDEAASRVAAQREGAAVLFNAVNAWPLEAVAPTDQAAVYIEVWPPHDTYGDLVDLIRRARDRSGKHVVLAAYLEPFREGGPGAEASARLATAIIASAGGFHLLLGEGHGVLRDPYYPNHGTLDPAFVPWMRRAYDHTAAFHRHLFGGDLHEVTTSFTTGINGEFTVEGGPVSARPRAGAVWVAIRQAGARFVVNLVNLVDVADDRWNVPKEAPRPQDGLTLRLSPFARVARVVWASPDVEARAHELLAAPAADGGTTVALPTLETWMTLVVELA